MYVYTLVYVCTHSMYYTTYHISLIYHHRYSLYIHTYTPNTLCIHYTLYRYPGHPESVDCMLKIDESTLLTGSSDGLIRVVSIQPNKILGVVGDHDDFPVEGMYTCVRYVCLISYLYACIV